jgi:hypothetical protein
LSSREVHRLRWDELLFLHAEYQAAADPTLDPPHGGALVVHSSLPPCVACKGAMAWRARVSHADVYCISARGIWIAPRLVESGAGRPEAKSDEVT